MSSTTTDAAPQQSSSSSAGGGGGGGISSLPAAAAQAATHALDKALDAVGLPTTTTTTHGGGDEKKDEKKEEASLEADAGAAGSANKEEKAGGVRTVFDDPVDPNVKHPLNSKWTLYYSSPQMKNLPKTAAQQAGKANGWMEDIKEVVPITSVEEFWGVYNNIIGPSVLGQRADYYLFKGGIIPAWEDPANKHGGKWSVQMPREKTRPRIDEMWLNMMLAAIGETYEVDPEAPEKEAPEDERDLITGVIINIRPNFYRLNIWTRTAPAEPSEPSSLRSRIELIGKHFKTTVLGFQLDQKIATGAGAGFTTEMEFASHKDSEKKHNTRKIAL